MTHRELADRFHDASVAAAHQWRAENDGDGRALAITSVEANPAIIDGLLAAIPFEDWKGVNLVDNPQMGTSQIAFEFEPFPSSKPRTGERRVPKRNGVPI